MTTDQPPEALVKRTIEYCAICKRRCLFYDGKCQGCFLKLCQAINEDAKLIEG